MPYLKFEPRGRLTARSVYERALQSLVAVGRVSWRALLYKVAQILDELVRGRKTAHTQREQDPAARVAILVAVCVELLADLTVDLVPQLGPQNPDANNEV